MNKRSLVIVTTLIVAMALLISSCATTNADGSPKWTTKAPSNWRTYYASGYGKLSNVHNSRLRAEANATDAIARWASVTVQSAVTNYFEDSENSKVNIDLLESISHQVVDITLRGIEVEKVWVALDGGVWVLSSFPIKNLKDAYRKQSEALEHKKEIASGEILIAYLEAELAKQELSK